MITVDYNPKNGVTHPDGAVPQYVDSIIEAAKDDNVLVVVGSEMIVDEFRVRIKRGQIPADGILFSYNGSFLEHDNKGKFKHWPDGFCDQHMKTVIELVRQS